MAKGGRPAKAPTPANPLCGVRVGSLIDAGLYMGQPDTLTDSWWNPAIYLDPVYWKELQRRNALKGDTVDLETYRHEQPARIAWGRLPRADECGAA